MKRHTPRLRSFGTIVGPSSFLLMMTLLCLELAAAPVSVLDAKALPDGSEAELAGVLVTASFPSFFYVAENQEEVGIRVESDSPPLLGASVDVVGVLSTNDSYERAIIASEIATAGAYAPPAITNKEVGGPDYQYDPGTGAGQRGVPLPEGESNNVGQLVRTTGVVTMGAPGDTDDFPIDDGSAASLLVVTCPGAVNPGYGATVTVTGISSLKYQAGVTRRAILLRGPSDLQVDQEAPACMYEDEMVYVPAGEFEMGLDRDPNDYRTWHRSPKHWVHMDGYWIGKHEVTRREYRRFVDAGGYNDPQYWSDRGWWWRLQYRENTPDMWEDTSWTQTEDHPVCGVSPYEMDAYCKWAGVRRESECEMEKAAGWDPVAQHMRKYPWGDEWDVDKCNNRDDTVWPFSQKTAPVGTYPDGISYYGCCDISGNVFEWCRGWYQEDWYSHPPATGWINPEAPETPEYDFYNYQTYRCGSWYPPEPDQQTTHRFGQYPYLWNADIGFRVTR